MDTDAISVIRRVFAEIDAAVPRELSSQTERARQLFGLLDHHGGTVESLGDVAYTRTQIDALGTWSEDPWGDPTYGIDASTTRPLEYNNGLVVDTAYGKTGVAGPNADRSIERRGQITSVVYFDDSESTLHSKSFDVGNVQAELVPFPDTTEERNVQKSVATVAQRLSESRQARRSLDAIDGPLFIDGAVLPLGVVYWLLLDHTGERSPAGSWDRPAEILRNYIEVIDTQYERGLPVVGIVKTSSMSQVLSALREKIGRNDIRDERGRLRDVPWVRDHHFLAEVLRHDDLDYLTYTSWLVDTGLEIDGKQHELLAPMTEELEHGDPDDYRRAFCYVRLPKNGDLLRIETPLLFVRDEEMREQVRLKALKEIAQRRGIPRAVERADRLTRISRENRDKIREMIERGESAFDHNWDGRWADIEPEFQTHD